MRVDSEAPPSSFDDVIELGRELGEEIESLPSYQAFEEAKAAVEADPDAQERIKAFEDKREEFMMKRQVGEATQEDLEAVQKAQQELHSVPIMEEFLTAQEALTDRLAEVNEAISASLVIDFGGEAGGCCHD
jgi:cell fate (sporulation/competence/biofilm development) regulator YlbF (YheA/YmcA/DUF963 family)